MHLPVDVELFPVLEEDKRRVPAKPVDSFVIFKRKSWTNSQFIESKLWPVAVSYPSFFEQLHGNLI